MKHYRRLLKPAEAEKWFQVRPSYGPRAAARRAAAAFAEKMEAQWPKEMERLHSKIRALQAEERQRLEAQFLDPEDRQRLEELEEEPRGEGEDLSERD